MMNSETFPKEIRNEGPRLNDNGASIRNLQYQYINVIPYITVRTTPTPTSAFVPHVGPIEAILVCDQDRIDGLMLGKVCSDASC